MKKVIIGIFLGMACFGADQVFAGGSYQGTIQPYFWGDVLYLRPVNATISNRPTCAKRDTLRLDGDPKSAVFQMKYTMILSAYLAGKQIHVTSSNTNSCSSEGDEWITIIKP